MFGKYTVDQMVIFSMISVHQSYGGKGIGSKLALKSEELIKKSRPDLKLVVGETTGGGSAKIFQRQGFEKLSEIPYETYVDCQGVAKFKNVPNPPRLLDSLEAFFADLTFPLLLPFFIVRPGLPGGAGHSCQ